MSASVRFGNYLAESPSDRIVVRRCPSRTTLCSPVAAVDFDLADTGGCPADSKSVRGGRLSAVGTADEGNLTQVFKSGRDPFGDR